ncbi:MAG: copper resistance CopC family protein, partial [Nitrososphaeraceae archaeon]
MRTPKGQSQKLAIFVTDSSNERVDKNDYVVSPSNPRESSISLDASKLKPGVYTVSWLVLSKDDGHISRGSYVFTIGQTTSEAQINAGDITSNEFSDSTIVDNVNLTYKISPFYSGINNNFTISLSAS